MFLFLHLDLRALKCKFNFHGRIKGNDHIEEGRRRAQLRGGRRERGGLEARRNKDYGSGRGAKYSREREREKKKRAIRSISRIRQAINMLTIVDSRL